MGRADARRGMWGVGVALLILAAPSLASAQRSALVLLRADDVAPERLERARAGAIEVLAEQGLRLVPTPDGAPCAEEACAAELAAATTADAALLLTLGPEEVSVVAVCPDGTTHAARAALGESGIAVAAGAAVERVLEALPATETGFLSVQTVPPGTAVRIDGADAGTTPLRVTLPPGEHLVTLLRPDGSTVERTLQVAPRAEAALVVDLARAPSDEPSDDGGDQAAREEGRADVTVATRDAPSPWNWALGGALAVGGIIALVSPLSTLARDGECTERIEDVGCVEQVRIGPQTGVLLGVGVALLIAAVVVDVTAPIRVDVAVSEDAALLDVRGRF